jgi:predicted DNA-binding transcriptional regulator AlpA
MARIRTKNRRGRNARKPAPKIGQKSAAPITLDYRPPDMARRRILDTAEAAEFCKLSVPHWRRLYRAGRVPHPVRLAERKYGWPIGDLVDWIEASRGDPSRR